MFQSPNYSRTWLGAAFATSEVVYHATVRSIRKGHGNALVAIAQNILITIILVFTFYVFIVVLDFRSMKVRGDFLLYLMSGIFLFMVHVRAIGAVLGAEGSTSPMMQHSPMNSIISVAAEALGALYIQVISLFLVLFVYRVAFSNFEVYQPIPAFGMLLVAWFTGISIGLILFAMRPWFPGFVEIFATIYQRANMIASGKMFLANSLPESKLAIFDWNPLFHAIDQCRGFTFVNYFPRNTSWEYPIIIGCILIILGLLGEFYTRQHASSSWEARR